MGAKPAKAGLHALHDIRGHATRQHLHLAVYLIAQNGSGNTPSAFFYHEKLLLRIRQLAAERKRRRGRCKAEPGLHEEKRTQQKIQDACPKWQKGRQHYRDDIMWRERAIKPQLQRLLRREKAEKQTAWKSMANHLHDCINDIIRSNSSPPDKFLALKRYKAKLILHHVEMRRAVLQNVAPKDQGTDEELTLYHSL
jgi:hypothetical protein